MKTPGKSIPIPKSKDGYRHLDHARHPCICCGRETINTPKTRGFVKVDQLWMRLARPDEEYDLVPVGPECYTEFYKTLLPYVVKR